MDNQKKVLLIISVAIVFSFILSLIVVLGPFEFGFGPGMGRFMGNFVGIKMFFSTLNIVLIGALLWNYLKIYQDIPNQFTLSLAIFSVALLLYALSSSPLMHLALGFRGSGLGPFAFIPDLFATAAVMVLLHQSYR